jgi:hypothetical protein
MKVIMGEIRNLTNKIIILIILFVRFQETFAFLDEFLLQNCKFHAVFFFQLPHIYFP